MSIFQIVSDNRRNRGKFQRTYTFGITALLLVLLAVSMYSILLSNFNKNGLANRVLINVNTREKDFAE